MTILKDLLEAVSNRSKKLVVIIKGNPKYVKGNALANKFYEDLQRLLERNGYVVEFDEGLPYTQPNTNAYAWIGHSRGIDRLQYAPDNIITIPTGGLPHQTDCIQHPQDFCAIGVEPTVHHYTLTEVMKNEFLIRLRAGK